jgi:hypothetical protein
MSVNVIRITDEELEVNGKKIYKDQNDKWIGQNLNYIEAKAANLYIASLEKYIENKKK